MLRSLNLLLLFVLILRTTFALPIEVIRLHERSTKLVSPHFTNYTITFNEPKLCDPGVKQYSGYMHTPDDKHIFFWFFEARNNPENAPVTLWLNGGPGCSSLIGIFEEMGPCSSDGSKTIYRKHSWTEVSNMLFLDQPTGTGYSYGNMSDDSTVKAGQVVYKFLQLWLTHFDKYQKLPFHIFGESYAGHYIPSFARTIMENNKKSTDEKLVHINLMSIGIGNGWIDALTQYGNYGNFMCENPIKQLTSKENCTKIQHEYEVSCKPQIQKCYSDISNTTQCAFADELCTNITYVPFLDTHLNIYNFVQSEKEQIPSAWVQYLRKPDVMEELGAHPSVNYTDCSDPVGSKFGKIGDSAMPFHQDVEYLLEKKLRVLLYAGDQDFICNWFGNLELSNKLQWSGRKIYANKDLEEWSYKKRPAGEQKSYGNLAFTTIYGAGHEVPYFQPEVSLYMFRSWLGGKMHF
ncbi:uncharacterized protein VTP21DRAFT_7680 [Calcarisporiella thermophila]|uniref:uncharacterized protein n=1 Tax=Calcarisporiella thermophila TaxID=911321 RepID=UPI0037433D7B